MGKLERMAAKVAKQLKPAVKQADSQEQQSSPSTDLFATITWVAPEEEETPAEDEVPEEGEAEGGEDEGSEDGGETDPEGEGGEGGEAEEEALPPVAIRCRVLVDGNESDVMATSTVRVREGDRVMCHIVRRKLIVFANITRPTITDAVLEEAIDKVDEDLEQLEADLAKLDETLVLLDEDLGKLTDRITVLRGDLTKLDESTAQGISDAKRAASAIGQYFWHDGNGAHVTQVPNNANSGPNLLANTLAILLRTGAITNMSIARKAINFYDGNGMADENVTASYTDMGVRIGKSGENSHVSIAPTGMALYDEGGVEQVDITSAGVQVGKDGDYHVSTVSHGVGFYDADGNPGMKLTADGAQIGYDDGYRMKAVGSGLEMYRPNNDNAAMNLTDSSLNFYNEYGTRMAMFGANSSMLGAEFGSHIETNSDGIDMVDSAGTAVRIKSDATNVSQTTGDLPLQGGSIQFSPETGGSVNIIGGNTDGGSAMGFFEARYGDNSTHIAMLASPVSGVLSNVLFLNVANGRMYLNASDYAVVNPAKFRDAIGISYPTYTLVKEEVTRKYMGTIEGGKYGAVNVASGSQSTPNLSGFTFAGIRTVNQNHHNLVYITAFSANGSTSDPQATVYVHNASSNDLNVEVTVNMEYIKLVKS